MAPSLAHPRTLDVASLAAPDMRPHQVAKLRSLLTALAGCTMGQRLLDVAADRHLVFRLATRSELMTSRGPSGGHYASSSRSVVVSSDASRDSQITTMAHELQHFVDHMFGWQIGTVQSEVRAQQTEALVIRQLGLNVGDCWALTASHQFRPPEAIANEVRNHPLYRTYPEEGIRFDGRVHPLLELHEVLPSYVTSLGRGSDGMRVGAVTHIAGTMSVGAVAGVTTGGVSQAVIAALGSRTPTCWDPEAIALDDTNVERFLHTLDARRLAMGA
ncbi:MAG: hypothetical protein JWL76_2293 [Thermoleophilia bacterium]|nr:hypothetical protein [Thermoleophilia bacterium]